MDVFLAAYLNNNLGDDLFVKILCDRYPNHTFHVLTKDTDNKVLIDLKNLVVHRYTVFDRIRTKLQKIFSNNTKSISLQKRKLVKKCSISVLIGGSIFIQNTNWKSGYNDFAAVNELSKKFYVIGSNFGPFQSDEFIELYSEQFEKLEDICFRDIKSYDLFSQFDSVRYAPDVVLTMNTNASESITLIRDSNYFIISVINLLDRPDLKEFHDIYIEKMRDLVERLVEAKYDVCLMSFCKNEGDEIAIEEVISKITPECQTSVFSYYYKDNLAEALSLIEKSKGMVSNRFHSLILAWVYKLKTYPLLYSNKTLNILEDINYPYSCLSLKEIESLNPEAVLNQLLNTEPIDVDEYAKFASEQFKKLDEDLK